MDSKKPVISPLTPEQKKALLDLAQGMGNVAQACRVLGVSRASFYRFKKAYDAFGEAALAPKPRRKPCMPNAFPESVVQKVLEETSKRPRWSYVSLGSWLRRQGMIISNSGVRKIWERAGLTRREQRIDSRKAQSRWISNS